MDGYTAKQQKELLLWGAEAKIRALAIGELKQMFDMQESIEEMRYIAISGRFDDKTRLSCELCAVFNVSFYNYFMHGGSNVKKRAIKKSIAWTKVINHIKDYHPEHYALLVLKIE